MEANDFGIEQVTAEDRRYRGSQFSEVKASIVANPYQDLWGGEGVLPLLATRRPWQVCFAAFFLLAGIICFIKLRSGRSIPAPIYAGAKATRDFAAFFTRTAYASQAYGKLRKTTNIPAIFAKEVEH